MAEDSDIMERIRLADLKDDPEQVAKAYLATLRFLVRPEGADLCQDHDEDEPPLAEELELEEEMNKRLDDLSPEAREFILDCAGKLFESVS